MGRTIRTRPKSLILLVLWYNHRAALQYDWIHAWGSPLHLRQLPWNTTWIMCREILKDHTSHSYTALAGYTNVPRTADQIIYAINASSKNYVGTPPWTKDDPFAPTKPAARYTHKPVDQAKRNKLNAWLGLT